MIAIYVINFRLQNFALNFGFLCYSLTNFYLNYFTIHLQSYAKVLLSLFSTLRVLSEMLIHSVYLYFLSVWLSSLIIFWNFFVCLLVFPLCGQKFHCVVRRSIGLGSEWVVHYYCYLVALLCTREKCIVFSLVTLFKVSKCIYANKKTYYFSTCPFPLLNPFPCVHGNCNLSFGYRS